MNRQYPLHPLYTAAVVTGLACITLGVTPGQAQPPIVQPGAPGEPSREISAAEASDLAGIRYTDADVKFMQGMIPHHAQALEMTGLLATRTGRDVMRQLARRIEISQEDEIAMMQEWLRVRAQTVTPIDAHHAPDWAPMPGMLSREEMDRLAAAEAVEFDRLFLELMIKHHRGALTMVDRLLGQRGAAQDSQLFAFTADITADQRMEIDRMDGMLAELSPDPRFQLAAGFHDAGQAAWNMALVATRPKPEGFYDPHTPAGRPMPAEPTPEPETTTPESAESEEPEAADEPEAGRRRRDRGGRAGGGGRAERGWERRTRPRTRRRRTRRSPTRWTRRTPRTRRRAAVCSISRTPISRLPAICCSKATTTGSAPTASRSRRLPNWSARWCAPEARATCLWSATC